jgi:hypothetical protein
MAIVESLNCVDGVINITPNPVIPNTPVTGTVTIPYTGGNGQPYSSVVINSTYNTGLTATLVPGTLSNGSGGNLVLNITGQVSESGLPAVFDFSFGGQNCDFAIDVPSYYPQSSQWYALYPCYNNDSNLKVLFSKAAALADHVNESRYLHWGECLNFPPDFYEPCGCYIIKKWTGPVPTTNLYPNINENNIDIDDNCNDCNSYCLSVNGTGSVSYISSEDQQVTTNLPALICTKTALFTPSSTSPTVIELSECSSSADCQIECYKLTNCKTGQIIHSNSKPLFNAFAGNKIVELYEYEGCWSVEIGEDCECLVDVTVEKSYADCITCLPIIAYRLINCEDENQIKYTEQDLSVYVDKTVTLDCGDCWTVEQIDYKPPSVQNIVITYTFDTCLECSRDYWLLFDCNGDLEPITTYTDMTNYQNSVIKLVGYQGCWTVSPSPAPDFANALEVVVAKEFEECDECLAVATCKCTKVTSLLTDDEASFTYVDCFDKSYTVTVSAGESTLKFCLGKFTNISTSSFSIKYSGECVEDPLNVNNKVCPVEIKGRLIKPGYKTPITNSNKFERITCETAEILYKQVLQQRYGISNCCPEEDENFIIKKELIDLESLNDPEFDCPLPSCCAPAECGCTNCIS